jgi:mRNA-degrading endonuclease RelE of RelBE toxin-antitoxin system
LKKRSAKNSRRFPIWFTDAGLRDVRALPKGGRNALRMEMLDRLARDPLPHSKPLGGPLAGLRSFRWRSYRVVFKLLEQAGAIAILGIGKHSPEQRKDIYRRLEAIVDTTRKLEKVLATFKGFSGPSGRN